MKCPYCDTTEEFGSDEDLVRHLYQLHPEKLNNAEQLGKAYERVVRAGNISSVSAMLTRVAIDHPEVKPDAIVAMYRDIYRMVLEWV